MSKTRRSAEFKNNSRVIDMDEAREKRQAKRRKNREAMEKRAARKERKKQPESRGQRAIRRRNNRRRIGVVVFVLAIALILFLLGFHTISLMIEKHQIEEQQQALLKEKAKLERELENADDKEALEDIAREKLRLIEPGEVLYMFPSDFNGGNEKEDDND